MKLTAQPALSLATQAGELNDDHAELIIDVFAGGGGASSGIESALGRPVDVAINHDAAAIELHRANHPNTLHLISDIFEVDPREVTKGRPVGLAWFSPDCTDHSKAKGGKPIRTKKRRSLAWIVLRWAGQVRPRVIKLENVEEFKDWAPLIGAPGDFRRDPKRKGKNFRRFVHILRGMGYEVQWREIRACDYGAPTIRKRLYMIARCDGQPIVWPEASHGPTRTLPYRVAGDCIDWGIAMLSIFASKEEAKLWAKANEQASPIRPLAENTNRRIARGVYRYVINNPRPYIVTLNHGGTWQRAWDLGQPMKTVTSARHAHALVSPIIGGVGGRAAQSGERPADQPAGTTTGKADAALFVTKFRSGSTGHPADEPLHTVTSNSNDADHKGGATPLGIVAGHLSTYHGEKTEGDLRGQDLADPADTVDAANRHGVVATFLAQYNGGFAEGNSGDGHEMADPLSTIATKGPYQGVIGAFLDQANGGFDNRVGRGLDEPQGTVCASGGPQPLVAASLAKLKGTATDADPNEPLDTIAAQGNHHVVAASHIQRDFGESVGSDMGAPIGTVTPDGQGKAALVASFLQKYYGSGGDQSPSDPLHTIPTVDRFGFVSVIIDGQSYFISDIAMRMLQPKELYAAQGFRPDYIFDRGANGKAITKTDQVRMCGNSVCPPVAEALVRANCPDLMVQSSARTA